MLAWLVVWALPWRPWSVREQLPAGGATPQPRLDDVDVLIPARNEAAVIGQTLQLLLAQGPGLRVTVVDDQSDDDTAAMVRAADSGGQVTLVSGAPLPAGWSGKVWALEQGRARLERPLVLLLDADIALAPGALAALRARLHQGGERMGLVSVMATLPRGTLAERLLLGAFVYFFKLLYPFALANDPRSRVAAAAGGCVLLRRTALGDIGGFAVLRDALIDDCTLARRVKQAGWHTWLGLSRAVQSRRDSGQLAGIWAMVERTAFTQLGYSTLLLLACTAAMLVAYGAPLWLWLASPAGVAAAMLAWVLMALSIVPTLRFYGIGVLHAAALPLVGWLYLAMTWTSAIACWRGRRSRWKAREYA